MGNSIFEFGEKMGYDSPWNDWLPSTEGNQIVAKVVSVQVEKTILQTNAYAPPTKDTETHFRVPITINVQITGRASRVMLSIDGQTGYASQKSSDPGILYKNFIVSIPKSFARVEMKNSKDFEIKVSITDYTTKSVSDTRFVKVVINSDGSSTTSGMQTEKEKELNCTYSIKNDFLVGDNVTISRTGNKVKTRGILQKPVKAIILHRTVGSSIAGAISHSIGTHFYVEGGRKGVDGEIFQAMSLKNSSSHILNVDNRISHLDVKTENAIGIEVVGLAYYKKNGKMYKNFGDQSEITELPPLTKAYVDKNGRENYWDALTKAQIKSITCLVKLLMKEFSIPSDMILTHEEIQIKTSGEGQAVKDAIFSYIIGDK